MLINELVNTRLHRTVKLLFERFDNSKWLLRLISNSVDSQKKLAWDPKLFYTRILDDIIVSEEFKNIFTELDLVSLPIVPRVVLKKDAVFISAKTSVVSKFDLLKYFRWHRPVDAIQMILYVPYKKPDSLASICFELESVVGHEITHIIQRLHRLKDEHYDPGELKKAVRRLQKRDAEIELLNTIHYTTIYNLGNTDLEKEIAYYLRHGELIAHAYTIAGYLAQYQDWSKILNMLYWYIWHGKQHILRKKLNNPAIAYLDRYAGLLQLAEIRGLISTGKAKKIWKKLFREIYRNCKNKQTI